MQTPPQYYQQPYPYQQQMMYYPPAPQPVIINNMMQQTTINNRTRQINALVRTLYFLFIGWWLGLMWIGIALGLCCTIIGFPVAVIIFHYLPAVLTLHRN